MDKVAFDKVFDLRYRSAKKMVNSFYLEDLTELLARTAAYIDDNSSYFFDEDFYIENHVDEPNCSFNNFLADFKNSYYNGSCRKINIIRGRAGIGKSLFFQQGIKQIIRNDVNCTDKFIYMGVDFKNIDNDEKIQFYEDKIYRDLKNAATDGIRILGEDVYKNFNIERERFCNGDETPHTKLFPLKYFCEKISNKYNKPCIIVFDNIDLASVKTQKHVFNAVVNVCNEFNRFMQEYDSPGCYRIYFAMRPETELRYNEGRLGDVINFPLPNILKLSLAIIKEVLNKAVQRIENEELPCNVHCADIMSDDEEKLILFKTFSAVAKYFYKILDYYLNDIWNSSPIVIERLGTSEEFHCNIVNYNLRTFLKFFSDTISNGGFKPLTKEFNQKEGVKYYSIYDYIEMIIRGRWFIHPGNMHINCEGGNKAPIVFNIFDTSLYKNTNEEIKHFMLNIRILQYFFLCTDNFEIQYEEMKQALSNFFCEEYIYKATQKLIYIGFIYSFKEGDDAIAAKESWKEIVIKDITQLKLSPCGRFYINHLIYEFEYLYQMALSSLMCNEYVNKLESCWKTEKELTVLYFLESIFQIIKINICSYSSINIDPFTRLFYYIDDTMGSRPYRKMLKQFISVMSNKVQRAERFDTNNFKKLKDILDRAVKLKKEVEDYFILVLGN